jgi:hypothetical protein
MFYTFNQNNSGGSFDFNAASGISHYVIVEADSVDEANSLARGIGLYFNGADSEWGPDCPCCGDRWSEAWREEGTDEPEVYGKSALEYSDKWKWMDGPEGFIHYKDGTIKSFFETA